MVMFILAELAGGKINCKLIKSTIGFKLVARLWLAVHLGKNRSLEELSIPYEIFSNLEMGIFAVFLRFLGLNVLI